MHEFAMAHSILKIALETAQAHRATRVRTVHCRIGAMRQVVPSLMQTAFEACCHETIAEGADLVLQVDPVKISCAACGAVNNGDTIQYECPACGSVEIGVEGGRGAEVTSIAIDQEDGDEHSGSAERAGAQRCHRG